MKGQPFSWFIGKVVDVNDPEGLNRVKVIPYSYYNKKIGPEFLPWSTVLMPNTLASLEGVGGNHQLMVDSWVVGFFRDAPACQDAIIIGSLASRVDSGKVDDNGKKIYNKDLPEGADVNNKVYTTEGGHTLHINNEDGKESINIKHSTGSYITMHPGGEIEIKSKPGKPISLNGTKEYDF